MAKNLQKSGLRKTDFDFISVNQNGVEELFVSSETLKDYLLLQRRAILQSVAADEKMVSELESIKDDDKLSPLVLSILKNANERRKSSLQIVRYIEKKYNMKSKKKKM